MAHSQGTMTRLANWSLAVFSTSPGSPPLATSFRSELKSSQTTTSASSSASNSVSTSIHVSKA